MNEDSDDGEGQTVVVCVLVGPISCIRAYQKPEGPRHVCGSSYRHDAGLCDAFEYEKLQLKP